MRTMLFALGFAAAVGCGSSPVALPKPTAPTTDEVAAERAALPAADRTLVDAQEWCAVNNKERLGSMGPPVKLDVNGQPVFLCCAGCKKKALADPAATLARVDGLKSKKKDAAN